MKSTEILSRTGWKYVYKLQEGEKWRVFGRKIVIVHPERVPKIIHEDGIVEVLPPKFIGIR